jgi:hypothetical protein
MKIDIENEDLVKVSNIFNRPLQSGIVPVKHRERIKGINPANE